MARIRVWKLGNTERHILPSDVAINRLAEVLGKWDGKSDFDIIWGPDIDVQAFELNPEDMELVVPADFEVVRKDNVLHVRKK